MSEADQGIGSDGPPATRRVGRIAAEGRQLAGEAALRVASRLSARRYVGLGPGEHPVVLEQPANVRRQPRWGHGRPPHPQLAKLLGARDSHYSELLAFLDRYGPELRRIPRQERDGPQPCWDNPMFSGIDGASLYAFIRERRPRRYFEVGSGYSTLFAHLARRDGNLDTRIISVDPGPRTDVEAVCDEAIRRRLEDVDLKAVEELEPGDLLLFDGSHRVFTNNDVSVFWLDVLPRVGPGVLVGIHDIVLPEDYPEAYHDWYWSEQYLLAVALLFGERIRPVLPCHHVCVEPALKRRLDELWETNGLAGINGYGTTFWFELDPPFWTNGR